jgi:hypothetical protein
MLQRVAAAWPTTVTTSTRPRAQDAEAILSVVVGYLFNEACQHFLGIRLRAHVDHRT